MGRVAGAYGVRGWVKAAPFGDVGGSLVAVKHWRVGADAFEVTQARVHGATVVAKLAGIETPEQAKTLKGRKIFLARGQLPEPGQGHYYLGDLIGLEVVNEKGERLGTVKALVNYGAHEVMEVAGQRTRLLPWVPSVVKKVDLLNRRIDVEWGAGW